MGEECVSVHTPVCTRMCNLQWGNRRSLRAEALWVRTETTSEGDSAPPKDCEGVSAPGKYRIVCFKKMSHPPI